MRPLRAEPEHATAPGASRAPRELRLESIRGLAAVAVVVTHTWAGVNLYVFDAYYKRAVLGIGLIGLYLFFTLSGYLLYLPFARRDFGDGPPIRILGYVRNRALRILPLYYAALLVLFVVNGGTVDLIARFGLFAQNFSQPLVAKAVNGPMWSLVVELHFYLLLPVLAAVLARVAQRSMRKAAGLIVGLGLMSVAISFSSLEDEEVWIYSLPNNFKFFVPGLLLALLRVRVDRDPPPWLNRSVVARADVWLLASVPVWALFLYDYDYAPITPIACFLVVGAGALPLVRGLDRVLDWRGIAAIGTISYSLYIWHVPILDWLPAPTVGGVGGFAERLALVLPVCLAVAVVSYLLIERPPMRWRSAWAARGSASNDSRRRLPVDAAWVAVLGMALITRVAVVAVVRHPVLGADSTDYDRLGRLIAAGDGFGTSMLAAGGGATAFRPPLYPTFLGGIYRAAGGSMTAARLAGALLGVVTVALIGVVAHWIWGRRVALVAGAIAAVYPALVLSSVAVMTESLFLALELGAVAVALRYRTTGDRRLLLACGVLAGLGALTRPTGAVIVVALAVLVWTVRPRFSWRSVAAPILIGVTSVLVVTPWLVRNAIEMDTFVPISNLDGFNLAGVYNEQAATDSPPRRGQFRPPVAIPELAPLFLDPDLDETDVAAELRTAGMDYLTAHPGYVPQVVFWNTLRLLDLTGRDQSYAVYAQDYSYENRRWTDLALVGWFLLAVVAVVGAFSRAARRAPLALWLTPLVLLVVTVPVLGHSRFRAPIEPFLILLAAVAVASRWRSGAGADLAPDGAGQMAERNEHPAKD